MHFHKVDIDLILFPAPACFSTVINQPMAPTLVVKILLVHLFVLEMIMTTDELTHAYHYYYTYCMIITLYVSM